MSTPNNAAEKKPFLSVLDIVVFAMLGTLMFVSKLLMEALPNIHLLGMFTMVFTVVFGKKALIPIYIFVMLTGLYAGFNLWWFPYLYIWTVLWAVTMLLPKRMPKPVAYVVYPLVCSLHGLAYGALYALSTAVAFGFDLERTIAWIVVGFPYDVIHAVGNLFAGLLIVPLIDLLRKILSRSRL